MAWKLWNYRAAWCAGAQRYFNQNPALKLNDCFALVLAEDTEDSILLTGDRRLRRIARQRSVEVHGVLWAFDAVETYGIAPPQLLYRALRILEEDELVFLPAEEIQRRLRRFGNML